MTLLHKVVNLSSSDNYISFPERIISSNNRTVNYEATSTGSTIGASGLRWWDSAVLPASGTLNLVANVPVTLPFTKSYLSTYKYDLILKLSIDGEVSYYATSNSLDNQQGSSTASNKILHFLDLRAFGLTNSFGNNNANIDFVQGASIGQSDAQEPNYVRFSEALSSPGTLTLNVNFVAIDGSASSFSTFTNTYPYPSGASQVTVFTQRNLTDYYINTYNYFIGLHRGWFKIQVINNNNSTTSLLNYYHWGIG